MGLRLNETVPNFTAMTDQGEITFHDWIGDSYALLFSHPKDFTPVCTTEFGAVAQRAEQWAERGVKVIGLSVDGVDEHQQWKADIEKFSGSKATFPIIADTDLAVSKALDMLPAEAYLPDGRTAADSATVRATFLVGPDKKIRFMLIYPMSVGRDFNEIIRAVDAVLATDKAPIATPAGWKPGDDVIIGLGVDDAEAKEKFGDYDAVLPYLRLTKAPA
ncbi:MAG TPA: peroxiredoxin [Aliiroseovarius sp.]|nr:peroxiredoxin [Aliiroseovarius sp.]